MRIRIIRPVAASSDALLTAHEHEAGPGTELSTVGLHHYRRRSRPDRQAMAAPGVIARAIEAQRDRGDAIVIDCMDDPGCNLRAMASASRLSARHRPRCTSPPMLGHRFSIIGTAERDASSFEGMVRTDRLERDSRRCDGSVSPYASWGMPNASTREY